jgi:drug/metabolite transporter (DMT)-like permease
MTERQFSSKLATLALIGIALIWGYNWVVMKVAIQYSSPFVYSALRVLLGSICLFLVLFWLHKPAYPKEIFGTFLAGELQMSGVYGLSTWALVSGGAGKTAFLNYTMPFWVLILAWLILEERLQKIQWLSIVIAVAGLFFILMPISFTDKLFSKGLALLSSINCATGIIVAKKLFQRTRLDLLSFTAWQMLLGSIPLILAAYLIESPPITWSTSFIGALIYSVILGNAISWFLWFYGLSRLPAGIMGLGTLAAPVVGMSAVWIQLEEEPSFYEMGGMLLILIALGLNLTQAMKSARQTPK